MIPAQQFSTVKLLKYIDKVDYFLLAVEVIFCIFIVYYIIEELLEIKANKMVYFYQLSNWMDLGVIGVSRQYIIVIKNRFA